MATERSGGGAPLRGNAAVSDYILHAIRNESHGDPSASAKGSSEASGLLGITPGWWSDHGLGMPRTPSNEIKAMVRVTMANERVLERELNRPVTAGDLYLLHFAGDNGGRAVLNAAPDTALTALLKPRAFNPINNHIKISYFDQDEGATRTVRFANFTAGNLRQWAAERMGEPHPAIDAPHVQPAVYFLDPNAGELLRSDHTLLYAVYDPASADSFTPSTVPKTTASTESPLLRKPGGTSIA